MKQSGTYYRFESSYDVFGNTRGRDYHFLYEYRKSEVIDQTEYSKLVNYLSGDDLRKFLNVITQIKIDDALKELQTVGNRYYLTEIFQDSDIYTEFGILELFQILPQSNNQTIVSINNQSGYNDALTLSAGELYSPYAIARFEELNPNIKLHYERVFMHINDLAENYTFKMDFDSNPYYTYFPNATSYYLNQLLEAMEQGVNSQ